MLPRQVVSYHQLLAQVFNADQIKNMSASLKLFPTPFKGIYYVPSKEERDGWFIEKPLSVLARAIALSLKSDEFYYGCVTAEEFWGLAWRPSGEVHVVNVKKSCSINLRDRVDRNLRKVTYRAKKIAHLLSFYGDKIVFHKTENAKRAKVKQTPYGKFASKAQIKMDKKRFK